MQALSSGPGTEPVLQFVATFQEPPEGLTQLSQPELANATPSAATLDAAKLKIPPVGTASATTKILPARC
jgi:hypothetical protein